MTGPRRLTCDCAIVGGGPAGAVLGARLARLGHRVALFDAGKPRGLPEETLLGGSQQALSAMGLGDELAACARPDVPRQGSLWDSDVMVWREEPADARGLRLPRAAFDAALRQRARAHGANVFEGHTVVGPLGRAARDVQATVAGTHALDVAATLWVVAAGRTFPQALVRRREAEAAPETAAITVRGPCDPAFADANVIEAVAEGWLWWLPLRDGTACVTLFADSEELAALGHTRVVAQALAGARGPARCLAGLPAHDATRATARVQVALDDVLLVGDAAASLDPLASQGVEKAIAAGDAAAVAVHTALTRPHLRARALQHHAAWEQGLFSAHAQVSAAFYRQQVRFAERRFWRMRRSPPPPAAPPLPTWLQAAPALRPAPALTPRGDHLEEETGCVRHAGDHPVSRVGRVALAPLLAAFAQPRRIDQGVQLAARDPALFVLSPALVHAAVAEAFARGYLVAAMPSG